MCMEQHAVRNYRYKLTETPWHVPVCRVSDVGAYALRVLFSRSRYVLDAYHSCLLIADDIKGHDVI